MGLLLVVALIGAAWLANAGRIVRMYFMTDRELAATREKTRAVVDAVVSSREERSLVTAIVAVESAGNPAARSSAGAVGLMQITQSALDDYNAARRTDYKLGDLVAIPELNVRVGYWYLRTLETAHGLARFDALRAYNVGVGTVRRDPSNEAGANYAVKVLAYAQRLEVLA